MGRGTLPLAALVISIFFFSLQQSRKRTNTNSRFWEGGMWANNFMPYKVPSKQSWLQGN